MYIATIPNRSSPSAILLRESFRQDGKVHSRTLANLSHWAPAHIQALRRALRGDFDHLASPDPTLGLVFGLLFVLKQIADSLGLIAALGKAESNNKLDICLICVYSKLDDQVHTRAVCFGI